MAWMEYHEQLRDHYKIHRLAHELKVPYVQALGHLSCLWCWTISNQRDGDLRKVTVEEIAYGARWEGNPQAFWRAMLTARLRDLDGKLHDWTKHGLRLLNDVRTRMARYRQERERLRNRTVTTVRERVGKKVSKKEEPKDPPGFEQFWSAYPRKVGKADALKAWERIAPNDELAQTILQAVKDQQRWPQWVKDGGQFIPHPETWLHGRRWEDEPPSEAAIVAGGEKPRSVADELSPAQRERLRKLTSQVGRAT